MRLVECSLEVEFYVFAGQKENFQKISIFGALGLNYFIWALSLK